MYEKKKVWEIYMLEKNNLSISTFLFFQITLFYKIKGKISYYVIIKKVKWYI